MKRAEEKDEAKAEYVAAIAQGKTAALLEEHRAEGQMLPSWVAVLCDDSLVFQVSLGNLRPHGDVEIKYALFTGR